MDPFLEFAPPGHFYSPLPDIKEILVKANTIFNQNIRNIPGVDLRENSQLESLDYFSRYQGELPFSEIPSSKTRYYYNNGWFGYSDANILYCFLRHYKPRRIIEVGSGFSSTVMLDTNDLFFNGSIHFTFIEPCPERLFSLIDKEDIKKHIIIKKPIQEVSLDVFQSLSENDILFVDSSHIVKIGSDVAHILFNVIPILNRGVLVHFHDILWPFEYPKQWLLEGRAWNEAYFLRAFLQFNNTFEILYFNNFIGIFYSNILRVKAPLCLKNIGGSLWIKKVN